MKKKDSEKQPCLTSNDCWREYRNKHVRRYMEARKKEVDPPIVPLLDLLNRYPFIVTTSSCAGRVVLLETDESEKKRESAFYRKWHRPVTTDEVWESLVEYSGKNVLWFKVDPFILHVAFSDLSTALDVIRLARVSGFKIAGIQTCDCAKIHVEIRGIDSMAVPLFHKRLLVSREYVRELVGFANRKMVRNAQRTASFFSSLLLYLSSR